MKNFLALLTLLFAVSVTFGQGGAEKWAELKSFHGVMSQTFHPSEKGDYKPIRSRAGEMLEKAEALQKSTPPAEFNNEKMKMAVANLVASVKAVKNAVDKNDTDEKIGKLLSASHDAFHQVMEKCEKEDEHEGHKH